MNGIAVKRWTKISLRTLHILAVAGVGGGVLFGLDRDLWINYWWLAMASGILMVIIDWVSNPIWIYQIRGVVIILKLALLLLLGYNSNWDSLILVVIIIISAVISHAPGDIRYYSIYHRKIISSSSDSKG